MLSAGLAEVLNLLTTYWTTNLCHAGEHVAKIRRYQAENNQEIIAEVQGNYPNFKHKLAKTNFIVPKLKRSQPLFDKGSLRAARCQTMTTRALSEDIRIWKPKFSNKIRIFSANSTKRVFSQPEGHMNNEEKLRVSRRQTLQAISQVMRVVVNPRKGQKQLKKLAIHLKRTLARQPIYDQAYREKLSTSSPSKLVVFMQPSFLLLFKQPEKVFGRVDKAWGNLFFDIFRQ